MTYIKYQFTGPSDKLAILSALLFEDGFEGIEEGLNRIGAFINQHGFEGLSYPVEQFLLMNNITFICENVEDTNWNKAWEDTFTPIDVDGQCIVRARHHVSKNQRFDVIIEPKMSFGTGHHPTTFLMIREMLKLHLRENRFSTSVLAREFWPFWRNLWKPLRYLQLILTPTAQKTSGRTLN